VLGGRGFFVLAFLAGPHTIKILTNRGRRRECFRVEPMKQVLKTGEEASSGLCDRISFRSADIAKPRARGWVIGIHRWIQT